MSVLLALLCRISKKSGQFGHANEQSDPLVIMRESRCCRVMFDLSDIGGKFITVGDRIRLPDDVTMGYIIEHLLKKQLTVVEQFHSHLEILKFLNKDTLHNQVSFSYAKGPKDEWNVVKIDGFDKKKDPSRFKSLHCYLFPAASNCLRR
ncbi:hypothetical protein TKK_0008861 [Trichogramma kaykai]